MGVFTAIFKYYRKCKSIMCDIKSADVFTYDKLYQSYKECRKGKRFRAATIKYHTNLNTNLTKLLKRLRNGTYHIQGLYSFVIYEPKKRYITANHFEDKIVQRLLCDHVLKPLIQDRLIYDNYASQPFKGTHLATKRLEKFMYSFNKEQNFTNNGYVLVCDIKKFFYFIDRTIMFQMVDKLPMDNRLKRLIEDEMYRYGSIPNEYTDGPNLGLCIGFQTSQWLAVYYLNGLDHFIKEKLGIKYYGRYMDDFYLIHSDYQYLEYCRNEIDKYLSEKLHLELNKKTHIHPFSQGICFLGYHCMIDPVTNSVVTKIRTKSVHRIERRIKKLLDLAEFQRATIDGVRMSLESWGAYEKHGSTKKSENVYNKLDKSISRLEDQKHVQHVKENALHYQIENLRYLTALSNHKYYKPKKIRIYSKDISDIIFNELIYPLL